MTLEPESISNIARENLFYVALTCWRCSRFETWSGDELANRFAGYPELTLDDLKARARCGICGARGDISRAWLGRTAYQTTEPLRPRSESNSQLGEPSSKSARTDDTASRSADTSR